MSDDYNFGWHLQNFIRGLLHGGQRPEEELTAAKGRFPEIAGLDHQKTKLTIPVYQRGKLLESMELDSFLKIERHAPSTPATAHRQFEFQIEQWEVLGRSESLQANVSITLSQGPQPRSLCIAAQRESDFPAILVYNAIFDVYVNQDRVLTHQVGLGVGTGVRQIPPVVDVAFQKPIQIGELALGPGLCACANTSLAEFEEAAARIRAFRTGPATSSQTKRQTRR